MNQNFLRNLLRIQIHSLATKYKLLGNLDIKSREDYEWLLIKVRAEIADHESKKSYLNVVSCFFAVIAIVVSLAADAVEIKGVQVFMYIIVGILSIILLQSSPETLNLSSRKSKKTRDLRKLEECISLYLTKI